MAETNKTGRSPIVIAVSLAALGLAWWAGARALDDASVLPAPAAVWAVIAGEAASGALWLHMGATLARVLAAFGFAMAIGTALGLLLGLFPRLNRWADPWVVVFLNLPALVVIVLAYLWLGLNEVAAIVAVSVNKTAMVIVTVREGVRARDPAVAEMAQVYRMGRWARLRHVLLPQLAPYLSTAVRNGLAVIWKIVLVVEFLGRSNGVGFQIHLYFQLFETAYVLAYSLSFVAVMLLIEYLVVQSTEARASRWRRAARSAVS
ncbi:MAG: ABC transporter permease [Rhodobacter sp.]|nr:ABC transporter permease [Rhodobacter sp.]